jgi:phage terminase Nu1 subunit (DNA packaging protein)
MTITLNRAQTAAHMGVDLTTLDRYVREGCPVLARGSRGREWAFDLPAVVRWYGEHEVSKAMGEQDPDILDIKLRQEKAKMLLAELELAKARGEVAPVREFELAQSRAMAAIQTRVMQVPQRVVMQLIGETDETKFKKLLSEELRAALEAASETDLRLDDDDEEDEDDAS